jgi:hypothetical protein
MVRRADWIQKRAAFTVCSQMSCGSDHRDMAVSPDAYASFSSFGELLRFALNDSAMF